MVTWAESTYPNKWNDVGVTWASSTDVWLPAVNWRDVGINWNSTAKEESVSFPVDTGYTQSNILDAVVFASYGVDAGYDSVLGGIFNLSADYNLDVGYTSNLLLGKFTYADFGINTGYSASNNSAYDNSIIAGIEAGTSAEQSKSFADDVVIDLLSDIRLNTITDNAVTIDLTQGLSSSALNTMNNSVEYDTLLRVRSSTGRLEIKWGEAVTPITWQNIQVNWNTDPKEEFPYFNLDASFQAEELVFVENYFYNVLGYTANITVVPLWSNAEDASTGWDTVAEPDGTWTLASNSSGSWSDKDQPSTEWSNTTSATGNWDRKVYID